MLTHRLDIYTEKCSKCLRWNSRHSPGYVPPRAVCMWDEKTTAEHVQSAYCPAGRYPFAGLGSVLGWFFWKLHLPQILRRLGWFNPEKCSCAQKQAKLNNIGRRIWNRVRGRK